MIRKLRGTVVSNKMDKTVVVAVDRLLEHPLYHKKYKATSKFQAHDAENACQVGDVVEITEIRPLSRNKRWMVVARVAGNAPDVVELADEAPKAPARKSSARKEATK